MIQHSFSANLIYSFTPYPPPPLPLPLTSATALFFVWTVNFWGQFMLLFQLIEAQPAMTTRKITLSGRELNKKGKTLFKELSHAVALIPGRNIELT